MNLLRTRVNATGALAVTAASVAVLGGFSVVNAQVVTSAAADAEIRETQPERTRGFGVAAASGQQAELQISTTSGVPNRNLALVRFALPVEIQTPADLLGHAEFRVFVRQQFNMGGGGSSLRLYGLDPAHPLNTNWNEQDVFYRDTGTHSNPNPVIGTGQAETAGQQAFSQPSPGTASAADPVAPLLAAAGYGADALHAHRAPGLRFENAPFSQQVQTENAARLTYNQNERAEYVADLADDGIIQGNHAYLTYFNQPGYNVQSTTTLGGGTAISVGDGDPTTAGDGITDLYSDVPTSNRPFISGPTGTWLDDLDTASTTFMGICTMQGGVTNTVGSFYSIGSNVGLVNTSLTDMFAADANLVAFLSAGLIGGFRDFTFILGPGVGMGGDVANLTNLQIASKDVIPAGGQAGDFAPRLVVAPEPGSALGLVTLGAMLSMRKRRP